TIPAGEGYKFEVSGAYNPIAVTEVRYIFANGTSNKGDEGESKWIVQGSNDNANWDDLCAPFGMFSNNSGAGAEYPMALTTNKAYRYYRFVLASDWTPNQNFTALHQLDFTVDSTVLSIANNSISENDFSVYPNPSESFLNIKYNANVSIKR